MSWDYRIVETEYTYPGEDKVSYYYGIYEVYYDDKNNNKIKGIRAISLEPIAAYGESVEELQADLELQMKAFQQPILKAKDIEYLKKV